MKKVEEHPSLLYLMGAGRCGSTVLSILIGSHPEVQNVGELKTWPLHNGLPRDNDTKSEDFIFWENILNQYENKTDAPCDFRVLQKLYHEVERCSTIHDFKKLATILSKKIPSKTLKQYHAHLLYLLGAIQRVSGKKIILDSSKNVCRSAAILKHPCLDAKVIHLIRDPRGTVWSFMKKDVEQKPKSIFRALFDYFFLNAASTLIRYIFGQKVLKVKYEDLINTPTETITRIFSFLNLDASHVLEMIERNADFEVKHLIDGNRVRKNRTIKFSADEEWKTKLPRFHKILCSITAQPLYFL